MKEDSNRVAFIDVARGLVIVAMIISHSKGPDIIEHFIFGFHMPFFFILSGYLWDNKKWNDLGFKTLLIRKWKSYIIPYFVLGFVNLIINVPVEIYYGIHGENLLRSTIKHALWILYSWGTYDRMPNCSPLWFLTCLFVCSIYFYFLLKVKTAYLRFAICVIFSGLALLLEKYNISKLPWNVDSALLGVVFMYIGYSIKEKHVLQRLDKYLIIIICMFGIGSYCIINNATININTNDLNNIVLLYVGSVTISVAIIILCYKYMYYSKFLAFLGRNTMIIMAFNFAINTYSGLIWSKVTFLQNYNYKWWILTLVNVIVCTVIILFWIKIKRFWDIIKSKKLEL